MPLDTSPAFRTVWIVVATIALLCAAAPFFSRTETVWLLTVSGSATTFAYVLYAFIRFGRRGWWIVVAYLPALFWPLRYVGALALQSLQRK